MKKTFFVFLILILFTSLFASNQKVCIYPQNTELETYFREFFDDISLVSNSVFCSNKELESGDFRLLEYICNKSGADILIIPIAEDIAQYKYLKLYVYEKENQNFSKVFEKINTENTDFGIDAILVLNDILFGNAEEINEMYSADYSLQTSYSSHQVVLDCSNTVADIYLNDKYLGITPYVLEDYYIPSVIKFCSEGFADRVYSLNDLKTENLTITLISDIKSGSDLYKKSQNKYFASFAAAILGWGSRIAVKALNIENPLVYKIANYASWGAAISTTAVLGFNIIDYFKTTKNTTP